jgi:predicted Rossmann fold nucleotide-binding protein DprA/Smf involved in DNA uptake
MNIAIIGSRNISDINLSEYIHEKPEYIISGGARGIDTIAEDWAKENGVKTIIFKPEYEKYGKGAPLRRNRTIVENSDIIYAFWDGESRGTKHTIDYAIDNQKDIKIIKVSKVNL